MHLYANVLSFFIIKRVQTESHIRRKCTSQQTRRILCTKCVLIKIAKSIDTTT